MLNNRIHLINISLFLLYPPLSLLLSLSVGPSKQGMLEYTDCLSAEESDFSDDCPRFETKQLDGDAGALGNAVFHFIAIAPGSILVRSGSTL